MNRNQRKRRPQTPKFSGTENKGYISAMREIRRSSATEPHRDRTKYDRRDDRRAKQTGAWL